MATAKPSDGLSIDVSAALDSARTALPAPSTPDPTQADATQDETPAAVSAFFNGGQADEQEEVEDSSETDTGDWLEVPVKGKTHRVDLRNKEELKGHISAGLEVKRVQSQLAKANQELRQFREDAKDSLSYREKAKLFEKLENIKDDENELYRVITGGKSLDDIVKAKVEKTLQWRDASPDEQRDLLAQEREQALTDRIARMEASAKNEREQAVRENESADEKKAYSTAYPEFKQVFAALNIKDPVMAQETATDLWELGWSRIARLTKQNEEARQADPSVPELQLTTALVRKQFQAAAARWGYTAKAQAKEAVTKIIDRKSADASKRAAVAATRNYSSPAGDDYSGLSPTKIFDKLFKR